MPWDVALSRPLTAGKSDEPLETIADAVAHLTQNHHLQRPNLALDRLLIALSLAAANGEAGEIAQATDQLEHYLRSKMQAVAA